MWGRLSNLAQTVQGITAEDEETLEGDQAQQQPVCSRLVLDAKYYLLVHVVPHLLLNKLVDNVTICIDLLATGGNFTLKIPRLQMT